MALCADSNCRDGSASANHSAAAPPAMTSQTYRRHMIAVTQFSLITVVYVISILSLNLRLFRLISTPFLSLLYYINHLSNFFIYLAVNKEFRNEVKILGKTIDGKIRCTKH